MLALRTLLLLILAAVSTAVLAQPTPADLGEPAGAFADVVYPVGFSGDGRHLAFVYRRSGGSAVASRLELRVQDLATDELVHDEVLRPEFDVEQDLGEVWRSEAEAVRSVLARYDIEPVAVAVRGMPFVTSSSEGDAHAVSLELSRTEAEGYDGPIASSRLTLHEASGDTKRIDRRDYEFRPFLVRVMGALDAPTGDRIAIVVEEVMGGFESDRVSTYRFVGAGIGDRF